MKIIRLHTLASAERVRELLSAPDLVNRNVRFDEKHGTPKMHVRCSEDGRVQVRCEMLGRGTKDNAFLTGTRFYGRLRERRGETVLSGVVLTEPFFHTLFLAMFVFFVVLCFSNGGFSPVPVCLAVFVYFMYRGEYRKQGVIARYLSRAVRQAEEGQDSSK